MPPPASYSAWPGKRGSDAHVFVPVATAIASTAKVRIVPPDTGRGDMCFSSPVTWSKYCAPPPPAERAADRRARTRVRKERDAPR